MSDTTKRMTAGRMKYIASYWARRAAADRRDATVCMAEKHTTELIAEVARLRDVLGVIAAGTSDDASAAATECLVEPDLVPPDFVCRGES